jgi:hypothetical protein
MPETSTSRRIPLIVWFLGFGILDLAAVLVLAYVFHVGDSPVYLYLSPPLVFLVDNPGAPPQGFVVTILWYVFLWGGSFVLYGLLGVLLGSIVRFAVSFRSLD